MAIRDQKRTFLSPIEEYLKRNHLKWLEKWLGREVVEPNELNYTRIKKILVVRQHDQLGDFLLAVPVLRALREHFPSAKIGVLVREYFYDVACCIPFVDEVVVFYEDATHWNWRRLRSLFRQLRQGWDLTVVLNTVSHSLTSDILAYFSGARYILGSEDRIFPGCSRNFFYNLIAPTSSILKHQSERNLDIVRYIGVETSDFSEIIHVPDFEIKNAREEMINKGLRQGGLVIGIHPGAGKTSNRWPVKNFSEVAAALFQKYQAQIVLLWGPAEYELSDQFCNSLNVEPLKIPPTNLARLAAYFTQCDALICNDTGVMHLAAASGVPLIAIFGATDPMEWKPVGKNYIGLRGKKGTIEDVDVMTVLSGLERLLSEKMTTALIK